MHFILGLQELMRRGDELPTLPRVVFQLQAALDDEDVSTAEVVAIIERDVALTARLLRAANSAALARGPGVTTVTGAVQRLGLSQVRSLCLVLGVVQAFGGAGRGLDRERFWAHSAAAGAIARLLWQRTGVRGEGSAEDAYVAGLLHDVGLLVMDQFFPKEFDAVEIGRRELDIPLWQHEEDHLGMDHGEVGGLMLGRWGLPIPIVDGVVHHHHPESAPDERRGISRVVAAAEAICHAEALALAAEGPADPAAAEALRALGIAESEIDELLAEATELGERAKDSIR